MTDVELTQAAALARCSFSPGSTVKRFVGWAAGLATSEPTRVLTPQATAFLDRLAHQYRKQIGKCMSVACTTCPPPVSRQEIRVALDSVIEGRADYAQQVPAWCKKALALYNKRHGKTFAHPYEYATKVAASSRRAHTLGDIYCRFCGERLFAQVKQPHKLVADSAEAKRHLTICALTMLAGMREAAQPGHRALPLEDLWRE